MPDAIKPKTRVRILSFVGPRLERDWSETGRVTRKHPSWGSSPLPDGYQPVRCDSDGAIMLIHRERLMVCNDQAGA